MMIVKNEENKASATSLSLEMTLNFIIQLEMDEAKKRNENNRQHFADVAQDVMINIAIDTSKDESLRVCPG